LQVGRAKEKAAEAERKKRKAVDKFAAFVRSAEGLYASTTWEEFEDAFKNEEEFVAVSVITYVIGVLRLLLDMSSQGPVCKHHLGGV
jgi:hypothetical protein